MGMSGPHPVPEYIRLIAQGRYDDAYMINWASNVFPGVLRPHLRPARANWPAGAAGWKRRNGAHPNRWPSAA